MTNSLQAHFAVNIDGPPDVRGDRRRYSPGRNDEVPVDFAIYSVAMGYASPIGVWPEETMKAVAGVGEIVALFRTGRVEPTQIEPTFADIVAALARISAQSNSVTATSPPGR